MVFLKSVCGYAKSRVTVEELSVDAVDSDSGVCTFKNISTKSTRSVFDNESHGNQYRKPILKWNFPGILAEGDVVSLVASPNGNQFRIISAGARTLK